jgi:membrane peptidoglycan carboxypeptidase
MSFKKVAVIGLGITGALTVGGAYAANNWIDKASIGELPPESYDPAMSPVQESYLCFANTTPEDCNRGNALLTLASRGNQQPVSLEFLDDDFEHALISAEDRRFYEHDGVDRAGIGRVVIQEGVEVVTDGDLTPDQGASTLEMQLARTIYRNDVPKNDLERKEWEIKVARTLNDVYGKNVVLEKYVNHVNYGRGAWSVETAAQMYFGKSAADLTIAESATLVAPIRGPGLYEGSSDSARDATQMQNLLERRNKIIGDMSEAGYITVEVATLEQAKPLGVLPYGVFQTGIKADYSVANEIGARHFVSDVIEDVRNISGYTDEQLTRNLRIMTTLDYAAQAAIYNSVQEIQLPQDGRQFAVVMQRKDASIAGQYGGNFEQSQVDLTDTPSVIGSADKPYAYATIFESTDTNLETVTIDPPSFIWEGGDNGSDWSIQGGNYCASDDACSVREAIAKSSNPIPLQLMENIGSQSLSRMDEIMHNFGIISETPPVPSIILGSREASLLGRTTGMNGLVANKGSSVEPYRVSSIWAIENDSPQPKYNHLPPPATQVIPESVASMVTEGLLGVARNGTARKHLSDFPCDLALKTGTYDDNLVAAIIGTEFGSNDGEDLTTGIMLRHVEELKSLGDGQVGGDVPGDLFNRIHRKLLDKNQYCGL